MDTPQPIQPVEPTPAAPPVKPRSRRGAIVFGAALVALGSAGVWAALSFHPAPTPLALRGTSQELNSGNNPTPPPAVIPVPEPTVNAPAPAPTPEPDTTVVLPVTHQALPAEVRGIYVTASTASSLARYKTLIASVKAKGVNTIVLDVKTEDGSLAFVPRGSELRSEAPVKKLMADFDQVVAATHEAGMYLIARMPVFEDPAYAIRNPKIALHVASGDLWKDAKGLAWLDPAAMPAWKYNVDIAREVYGRGGDEIQFDYVRFATDGSTNRIVFPVYDKKSETMRDVIGRFFAYLDKELRAGGIPISVDVFGFTTWHQTDLGIGQWYADALAHSDFVSPMVYPSHYPAGTLSFKNPADHPYEIVADSLKKGGEVIAELKSADAAAFVGQQRPWIQAFNMGAVYTPEMIMAQVRAAREISPSGFLLWNAGNNYSSLPNLTK